MIIRPVTREEIDRSYEFAQTIINGGNQFNRFHQNIETQINRTYIGKLAELIFLNFLNSRGLNIPEGDMFEIFEGAENADAFDFIIPDGRGIDIKTASLPFHSRIMVPISQFHLRKDFYVGIKLIFATNNNIIDPKSITTSQIHGFVTRLQLEQQPTQNFGEGNCKAYPLNGMTDIETLINMFV